MDSFTPVWFHRLRYMLTPQLDLYQNIRKHTDAKRILDFGCGNGFGTIQLLPAVVIGVDEDEGAIEFARSTLGHLAHFHTVGALTGTFDVITCIEVIEHVEDVDALFELLKTAAKPDATFIFSTLNHNSQYRKNAGHVGRWCVEDFRTLMESNFTHVRITDYLLCDDLTDDSTLTPMVAICRV